MQCIYIIYFSCEFFLWQNFAFLHLMMFLSCQIGDNEAQSSPCHATHPPLGHVSQPGGWPMLFSHNILDPLLVLPGSLSVHPAQDLIEELILPGTLYSSLGMGALEAQKRHLHVQCNCSRYYEQTW